MLKIRKKILTDKAKRPVSVEIDYSDWLEIERSLDLRSGETRKTDLSAYDGVVTLTEDPVQYQSRLRQEWS